MAVFYRTNSQSRALEEIFIRSAVPYKIMGGTKFYERAEIKDALAYLVAVSNPADEMAMRRIINRPAARHRRRHRSRRSRATPQDEQITFRDALANAVGARRRPEDPGGDRAPRRGAGRGIRPHAPVHRASSPRRPPSPRACSCCSASPATPTRCARAATRRTRRGVENLDELVAVAREFARNNPEGTVIDFLAEVALVSDADDLEDASGSVSLMTMHTAKGLEYDAVFVTGVEEDLIPHRISAGEPGGPQEERRLFYVGITRARKRLYLSLAMTRAQFGEVTVAMPSRFLQEIPAELIHWRQSPGDVNSRGRHAVAGAQRAGVPGRAAGAVRGDALRRRPRSCRKSDGRSSGSRTASRRRCATTATWSSRRATASVTTTSARDGWMPSPARARSASRTCASTRSGPKKLLIKIAPIEKL